MDDWCTEDSMNDTDIGKPEAGLGAGLSVAAMDNALKGSYT